MLAHHMHYLATRPELLQPVYLESSVKADWAKADFAIFVADPQSVFAGTAAQLECGRLKRGAIVTTKCQRGLSVGRVGGFFEVRSAAGSTFFVHIAEYRHVGNDCWDTSMPRELVVLCSCVIDSVGFVQKGRPNVIRVLPPPAVYVERHRPAT